MKKNIIYKTSLLSFICLVILSNRLYSQTQNYFGSSGTLDGSYWNTSDVAPYTSALVATGGGVANFNTIITTSPNLANDVFFYGINVTQDVTFTRTNGIIRNYNNTGNMVIDVSAGKTFNCSAMSFSGVAAAGQTKNGSGTLVTLGGNFGGGYTLNAGTIVAAGTNAMGGNAVLAPLNINGGTIAASSATDFSGKYSAINVGGNFTLGSTVSPALSTANLTFNTNTVLGNATRTITIGGTGTYTLGGVISGDAGIGLTVNATAAGSLKLSGANTYTGTTTVNAGIFILGSSSALGTVDGATEIASGANLDLGGINYSTAEPLIINGTGIAGGGTVRNNSASAATFSGPITFGASGTGMFATSLGTINLTNTISGTGNLTLGGNGSNGGVITGVISNTGAIDKLGTSTWTLSAANTYTSFTSIGAGTLCLGASGVIPDGSTVVFGGGTLSTGATSGYSETVGLMNLTDNSTLGLGTGAHTLSFLDSHGVSWTAGTILTITGWTGTAGISGTAGKIFVGSNSSGLTAGQLLQIVFSDGASLAAAQILNTGEVVPVGTQAALTLTASPTATVDGTFDITFTDDPSWRSGISSITVNGTTLSSSAYDKTVAGQITFNPALSTLLQTAGSKTIVVLSVGYNNSTVSQTIAVGAPSSNSTVSINTPLARSTASTITCTAKDQYNNLVSGYNFKYDLTITDADATTDESFLVDGTSRTSSINDVVVVAATNGSGVATFSVTPAATVDAGDGISIQLQLTNGSTNVGSALSYSNFKVTGASTISGLGLTTGSDITVSSGGVLTVDASASVKTVTVGTGGKLNFHASTPYTLTIAGDVVLKSDATTSFSLYLGAGGLTVSGNVYYDKLMDGSQWYFLAFPCNINMTTTPIIKADGSAMTVGTNIFIKYYNGMTRANLAAGSNWKTMSAGTTLKKDTGYIYGLPDGQGPYYVRFPLTTALVASESVHNVAVALNAGTAGAAAIHQGWNLVGCPYLSNYTATGINTNLLTLFCEGYYYATFTRAELGTIAPFTAYFIQADASLVSSNLTFDITSRQTVKSSVSTDLSDEIRFNITSSSGTDKTNLIIDDTQSPDYQIGHDMVKWMNTGTAKPQIYSVLNGNSFAYNALPIENVQALPLGIYSNTPGDCIINADASQAPGISQLLLTDNSNGVCTDLLISEYHFSIPSAGVDNTRFSINAYRLATMNQIKATGIDVPNMLFNEGKLMLNGLPVQSTIQIYDAFGRLLVSQVASGNSLTINLPLKSIFVVRIQSNSHTWIRKIVSK